MNLLAHAFRYAARPGFCLFFSPWLLVCFFVPFGCQVDAKDVQKRPQGHPFGQQKLTKLALDHGSENMAPVQ